ncbi:histidine kinase [Streptomyces sp. XM4193]|uniref:sensor histidine kinase n=1 Tax=Streptomyces sp. XM4193 TaxID=2929782 RepID=UPI001FF914FD|nr:histidine kinase [Streptomyces sp. XM4193]MCK1794948.1 histidine kinase [Streptomyces sp. XM4193]
MDDTIRAKPSGGRRFGPRAGRRAVRDAWRTFREDMTRGAFTVRPLRTASEDALWLRHVPAPLRTVAAHWRQGLVLLAALLVLVWYLGPRPLEADTILSALLVALPVAMLALRPVGAYWLSLAGLVLAPTVHPQLGADFPHNSPVLAAHLTVLLCVAWRAHKRTVVLLWMLTSAVAGLVSINFVRSGPDMTSEPGEMAFLYGAALLVLLFVRAWRGSQLRIAEQSAEVREERSLRTRLEERAVIARELHDVVAHHMSVVAIQAEAAPYRVQDPPEELVKALATIRENAVTALAELRRVLGVVRSDQPAVPEAPQPTLADLDALVANVRASGRDAELVITGSARPLPPGVELSAYRIVQESLSNALRYAPGAAVRVELAHVLGGLGIRVASGPPTGPVTEPSRGAGQGIRGMKERAALLGGELTAGAREDGGWDVEAYLPAESRAGGGESVERAAGDSTATGSEARA